MEYLPQPAIAINNTTISHLDVLKGLQSLDTSKSMGIDGIGPKLLKSCAVALYVPIHHVFSLSITNHVIPSEWKCLSIMNKSSDRSQVTNYRPISLLCVISKVLGRIVYAHLKFVHSYEHYPCWFSIWLSPPTFNNTTATLVSEQSPQLS